MNNEQLVEIQTLKNIAYPNLRAEMAKRGILVKHISELLGKTDDWVDWRMRGKTTFNISDAMRIKNTYFKDIPFEYLFSDTAIIPIRIDE